MIDYEGGDLKKGVRRQPGIDSKYSNNSGPIREDGHLIDIFL